MRVARWYYLQDPTWPEPDARGKWFKRRALYFEILKVLKENPGMMTSEVARTLGRPYTHVAPLLFHLKRFGTLRKETIGHERTPGLEEFAKLPCVQRTLDKFGSEKTKGPWRRLLLCLLCVP